ncbi:MAG: 4a-hydroxytetrahydrobiopterin dehydratase [bacterium]
MDYLLSKGWAVENNRLLKNFVFDNHKEVILFFNTVSFLAEKYNHHPDIFITYKKCVITLYTHSQGKITEKDVELAVMIEKILDFSNSPLN